MRSLLMVIVAAAILSSGCFDTFRVHVSATALEAADVDWRVEEFPEEGDALGMRIKETRYVHRGEDDTEPPFPGVVQVFSLRGNDATDLDKLHERAMAVLMEAIENEGITLDETQDAEGQRKLRSGAPTHWFLHEGTIESGGGDFFDPDSTIRVRILGEVGSDGKSSTGFIAIAFVKVEHHSDAIAPTLPGRTVASDTTWFDVVADPEGSISGASFASKDRGLLYNLVTHG